ncbi:aminopeptidase P family protein [Candidatus Kaiserbacteria bacterium]|nr:aminopeptidase P family protein [Candidatus Kaiserbacteria bacterium]
MRHERPRAFEADGSIDRQTQGRLLDLMREKQLDLLLFFSTKNDPRYSQWLFKVEPLLMHYSYLTKNGESGILELDYLAEGLGPHLQNKIRNVSEEDKFDVAIKELVRDTGARKVGIVGLVPQPHVQSLNAQIVDVNENVNSMLVIKSPEEVERIEKGAQSIAYMLDRQVSYEKLVGKTEKEAARMIKQLMFSTSDQESFPVSVVSGPRLKTATAGSPSDRVIQQGETVAIDCGFFINGRHTDITRMYFPPQGNEHSERYKKLVDAHHSVISRLHPDVTVSQVLAEYNKELKGKFPEGYEIEEGDLGHSIGYGLHEPPIFIQPENRNFLIQKNMVFTLEPEIVVGGWRYRVEDMVASTPQGFRILTEGTGSMRESSLRENLGAVRDQGANVAAQEAALLKFSKDRLGLSDAQYAQYEKRSSRIKGWLMDRFTTLAGANILGLGGSAIAKGTMLATLGAISFPALLAAGAGSALLGAYLGARLRRGKSQARQKAAALAAEVKAKKAVGFLDLGSADQTERFGKTLDRRYRSTRRREFLYNLLLGLGSGYAGYGLASSEIKAGSYIPEFSSGDWKLEKSFGNNWWKFITNVFGGGTRAAAAPFSSHMAALEASDIVFRQGMRALA